MARLFVFDAVQAFYEFPLCSLCPLWFFFAPTNGSQLLAPLAPMDRLPLHPLHYTPVNGGAKWNSIFSAA
jgi:hypothetical protein